MVKVKGSESGADLLTKHLVSNIIAGHVNRMNLEFRSGRAEIAVQLHMIQRHHPQGEFVENSCADKWIEQGQQGMWVRKHRTPRVALFTPFRVPHGPG